MKTRMVKVERGEDIWFEAQYRWFFIWRSCWSRSSWGEAARYGTREEAADAITRFRRLFAIEKRTVVRNY